ncbi:MAG: glycine cleavage system aminomethyltransferase GcvT [Parachlamydiaceae bacterium]|nr:glycine cleavage system aminomethyltransferase GcvT [Parachlamydiaceae bacterium]
MKTILYDRHKALGAQFVDFGGWEMPLQYTGILQEHAAVRTKVGLFDVSHMGRISIEGDDAELFLDYLSANKISGKKEGSATYTVLCTSTGGSVDDTIIYCIDKNHYFMIANASNRQKDLAHLQSHAKEFKVSIYPSYENEGILAIQGPASRDLIYKIFPEGRELKKPMHFLKVLYKNHELFLSATGYTGESGFELYASNEIIPELWDLLLKEGSTNGIVPVGLGARNTLRLEMGYALYGHEISDTIAPTESVARWSVKLDKQNFLGKEALVTLENAYEKRFAYGIVLLEPGVARDNYLLYQKGIEIGIVSSGSFSPTLTCSIALAVSHVPLELEEKVEIKIREHFCAAKIVHIPFLTNSSLKGET